MPGNGAVRLDLEWSRLEPREGSFDEDAFERHAAALGRCRDRGLVGVVVLHRGDHPQWLGEDLWLRLEAPVRFAAWAAAVEARLGGHCRHWVTLDRPNGLAVRGWLTGAAAPVRVGAVGDVVRSLDHLLAAHVAAYGALHRGGTAVTTTLASSPLYEVDGLATDVLTSRAAGVGRHELHDWLRERREAWYAARRPPTLVDSVIRAMARSALPLEQALPRAIDALWAGRHARPLDDLGVVLPAAGDPAGGHLPGRRSGPRRTRSAAGRVIEAAVLDA